MNKSKILLQIEDLNDISYYKELGVTNFLFPLSNFSIGYNSFNFDEISGIDNAYVLANRLLTDDDIDEFLKLKIPSNIKGFIIEDTGLLSILANKGYEIINFQNHLNNNYYTVNYWLKYFDSLVVSTDITEEEVRKIIGNANKSLVLNTFGFPMIMYSRRTLISNFYKHLGINEKDNIVLNEKTTNSKFFAHESEFGTAVFNSIPIDYRSIIDDKLDSNIKFYLINSSYCDREIVKDVILGKDIAGTRGFLDRKTIYKVGT